MDPNQALLDALQALMDVNDGTRPASGDKYDRARAADALEALAGWIRSGGFAPTVHREPFATMHGAFYVKVPGR